jgi:hypothetical protein
MLSHGIFGSPGWIGEVNGYNGASREPEHDMIGEHSCSLLCV